MHNQRTLVAALAYAAHGWAVFPVPPGTKWSYKSAEHSDGRAWGMTREAAEIRADFTRWPDAGIGIVGQGSEGDGRTSGRSHVALQKHRFAAEGGA